MTIILTNLLKKQYFVQLFGGEWSYQNVEVSRASLDRTG